jgi:hypothetical protein
MKPLALATLTILMLSASACSDPSKTSSAPPPSSDERDLNTAEVEWYNKSAIDNAIIAQHTLYPYHFVPDGESVNELGEHDLNVLIDHFKNHPGKLNVRRGSASAELYQARVNFVIERMFNAGVRLGPVEDGLPGGEGMSSERVLVALKRTAEPPESQNGGGANDASTGKSTRTTGS